ncbi:MAG: SPOR domain-containing protein, partial [Proteobacteria bacterium]|nr:SPOR domain-containing protein [Pseudomonadota bacterium]
MSKDYKGPARKPAGGKSGAGSLLIGILIGLLLGLGIALAVAWYINKMPTPFVNRAAPPPKGEPLKNTDSAKIDDKTTKAIDGKPRFDFYKILPGSEEPVTEQQFKDAQKKGPLPAEAKESSYLQAG